MDDRGRLAQSLNRVGRWLSLTRAAPRASSRTTNRGRPTPALHEQIEGLLSRLAAYAPRGAGISLTAVMLVGSIGYGMVKGDHLPWLVDSFKAVRDGIANAAGLRIETIMLTGNQHVSREEVLAIAGITGSSSMPFLDVDDARERLKATPWIADATVLKLYPRELQIAVKERAAFALWQKQGRVSVIAEDGTVLEPYVTPRLIRLPLVVGEGAGAKAKQFLADLESQPSIKDAAWASILVSGRRWNLRLKNGVEVRLPESDVRAALKRLAELEREKNLTGRDITVIDLRLPDRVTLRLSNSAAEARIEAAKDKLKKKPGNA